MSPTQNKLHVICLYINNLKESIYLYQVVKEGKVAPFPFAPQRTKRIASRYFIFDYKVAPFACHLQEINYHLPL